MGHAINRTTLEVIVGNADRTAATPYDPVDWFFVSRPGGDARAVADFDDLMARRIPVRYWNLVDGHPKRILEKTRAQKDAIEEARLPVAKSAEILSIETREKRRIANGFEFPAGSGVRFASDSVALTELLALQTAAPSVSYPIVWISVDGTATITLANEAEVVAFVRAACDAFAAIRRLANAKKAEILSAATRADLAAVPPLVLAGG